MVLEARAEKAALSGPAARRGKAWDIDTGALRATLPVSEPGAARSDHETGDGQVVCSGARGDRQPSCRGSGRPGEWDTSPFEDPSAPARVSATADDEAASSGRRHHPLEHAEQRRQPRRSRDGWKWRRRGLICSTFTIRHSIRGELRWKRLPDGHDVSRAGEASSKWGWCSAARRGLMCGA